jgi:hypothetical protein
VLLLVVTANAVSAYFVSVVDNFVKKSNAFMERTHYGNRWLQKTSNGLRAGTTFFR